jgi:hypothetical protein
MPLQKGQRSTPAFIVKGRPTQFPGAKPGDHFIWSQEYATADKGAAASAQSQLTADLGAVPADFIHADVYGALTVLFVHVQLSK